MIWQDKTILIVDDEPSMCRLVATIFEKQGAQVLSSLTGESGLRALQSSRPDLVILDILLPGMDGLEVCRRIREFSHVPIVMLTAVGRDAQVVRCLYAGADDYVTKPFSPDILKARAWAVIRRVESWPDEEPHGAYDDDYLIIDLDLKHIEAGGNKIELTSTEYQVLEYLYQNANQFCGVKEILTHIYGNEFSGSAEEVRLYVWHLRRHLEPDPSEPMYLAGDQNIGYAFQTRAK